MARYLEMLRGAGLGSTPLYKFLEAVSQELDASDIDVRFPQVRIGAGGTAPTVIEINTTLGWLFALGNVAYGESPLSSRRDTAKDVVIGCGWAPSGADPTKFVKWQFDILCAGIGRDVTVIDYTKSIEVPCPASAAIYQHAAIHLSGPEIAAFPETDELHFRMSRIASSDDPATPPGLHHFVVVTPLL